jgi:fatty-acyl-CoA synthase
MDLGAPNFRHMQAVAGLPNMTNQLQISSRPAQISSLTDVRGTEHSQLRPSRTLGTLEQPLVSSTIGDALSAMVARQPAAMAIIVPFQNIRWSYGELAKQVERAALALLKLGVAKGDRVGIWSQNCAEWTVIQFAAARVGAILVNVNPAYRADEAQYALSLASVRILFTATQFKSSDYLGMLAQIRAQLPVLECVVTLGTLRASGTRDLTWREFSELPADAALHTLLREREATLCCEDPINIQFTSGTTGRPKGATLTHRNILNNAHAVASILGYTARDRVCIPLPLYHCFGMGVGNLGCVSAGACMVYPTPVFDALATLTTIEAERCTSVYGVPTMFIAQLEHPRFSEFDLRSLRTGLMGGAPCPIETMKRVVSEMHAEQVCTAYGMTETSPGTFMSRPHDPLERRVSTVGTVLPHIEAKIIDPQTGLTQPIGVAGEVCTRGYAVMPGYWHDPAATSAAIDMDGWMHTGDLGVLDDGGYLSIVGRIKDMVIRGGENIYPREVEELLHQHPAIASAQVVGVPDPLMGEELVACVVVREGNSLSEEEVREFCHARISHFKVPRYVRQLDSFPLTVTGKVQKFLLREQMVRELRLPQSGSSND